MSDDEMSDVHLSEPTWFGMLSAALAAGRPAVIDGAGDHWSGAHLARVMAGAADWLESLGDRAPVGHALPALLEATPDNLALIFVAGAINRPLALIGPRQTQAEIAEYLHRMSGGVLIADRSHEPLAHAVAAATGRQAVIVPQLRPSDRALPTSVAPEATAFVLHTSGTTGNPKQVSIRQDRLAARARNNATLLGLGPGAIYATATGFHHISGLGGHAVALAAGAAVTVTARYTPPEWKAWSRLGVTHALLVPTMITDLLDEGALASPTLRCLQYGAAPVRPDVVRRMLEVIPDAALVQFYGQTEGTPIAVLTAVDHVLAADGRPELLSTVGRPAPGVELQLRDPDGQGIGEVTVRAAHLFVTDDQGWLATGDLGRLDADGYLHLEGRLGDKIIRGGENIYPAEVELVLAAHPQVADAAVIGIPDERLGEVAKAYVVPVDLADPPTDDELHAWCRGRLSGFKVPAEWAYLSTLPRNAGGKVMRRCLRQDTTLDEGIFT